MRLLFVLPSAKTSNEIDTYRAIPETDVVVVGNDRWDPDVDIRLSVKRVPWLGSPDRWTAALAWFRGLGSIDVEGIDAVVSLELYSVSSEQASRFASARGVPHIVVVCEVLNDNPLYRLPPWNSCARRVVLHADAAVCATEMARRHAIQRGVDPERTFVISPGVDTAFFRPATVRTSNPTAVFVGELRRDKGIGDVLAAGDIVARRLGPAFRLIVVGNGPLMRRVLAARMSRPWLDVRGKVPRDRLPVILEESAAFVLAPFARRFWAEQFGYASVEAMACGLPVVATRSGAIPEVIPAYNPLVPEHDVKALSSRLFEALGAAGSEWGARNREFARAHYDLVRQAANLGTILERICAQGRQRERNVP